ncbi:GntR family transcriptional regulator [Kaistia soli DSM 19436]|uniref:GntR family transcriptional regulator n=1 Tax=Kaistia soli DSM 19436 TaxID=1122133 RepID=A0A1M5I8Y4_9HYPH|nr:GntR family transcriptional regulator [Kaistia soli]SHG24253.1 GntR family transcriptional regulator [Kaistia soli DSM 19436]
MRVIDRASAEPYYQQLARILAEEIKSGTYPKGSRLPGETDLCRSYDLSRSTVRETLRTLEQQRLIRMVPRRGAFVSGSPVKGWTLQVTEGFLETSSHAADRVVETEVLRAAFVALPEEAAAALELPEGQRGFVLERLRRVDGKPAVHSLNYLTEDAGAALLGKPVLAGQASLNETLREAGFAIYSARRDVAAVPAPPESARLLEVSRGSPLLLIQSASRGEGDRPFDFYRSYVRSDVIIISVNAEAHEATSNQPAQS